MNGDEIRAQKRAVRTDMRRQNRAMADAEKERQALQVWLRLAHAGVFDRPGDMLLYWALTDELPTQRLIEALYPTKRILLPVIDGETLIIKEYKGPRQMQAEPKFGVLEPTGPAIINLSTIATALIPGLAFDHLGNRLGRGKGYYDRLLPLLNGALTVGVGFEHQIKAERIAAEPHDIRMDMVCSPSELTRR